MGGMMGGMGGGSGGMGMPGLPQQNGTENNMPSQNIMGMQVPDFMGMVYKNSQQALSENPYAQSQSAPSAQTGQMPVQNDNSQSQMDLTNQMIQALNGQINNIGTGKNPGTSPTPMYQNGLPIQNYGLNLNS